MSIQDIMDTTGFRVGHAIHNLFAAIDEIDSLRRSNEARAELQSEASCFDLDICRDRLSRILDDVGGK